MKIIPPRPHFFQRSVWILLCLASFGFAGGCQSENTRWKGLAAPDFTLPSFSGGQIVNLSSVVAEKPVLLIFWATWCPACVHEIPRLNKLYRQYPEDELSLWAIVSSEDRGSIEQFMKKHAMDYSILYDEDGKVAEQYDVREVPTMILLAKGGKIIYYGYSVPKNLGELIKQGAAHGA